MVQPSINPTPPSPIPLPDCAVTPLPEDSNMGWLLAQSACPTEFVENMYLVLIPKCFSCAEEARQYVLCAAVSDLSISVEQKVKTFTPICGSARSFAGRTEGSIKFSVLAADLLGELRTLLFKPTTQFVDVRTSLPYVREGSTVIQGQSLPLFDIYLNPNASPEAIGNATVFSDCQLVGIEEIVISPDDPTTFKLSFLITNQPTFIRKAQ